MTRSCQHINGKKNSTGFKVYILYWFVFIFSHKLMCKKKIIYSSSMITQLLRIFLHGMNKYWFCYISRFCACILWKWNQVSFNLNAKPLFFSEYFLMFFFSSWILEIFPKYLESISHSFSRGSKIFIFIR